MRAALLLLGCAGCWEMLPASKDPVRDALHHEQATCSGTAFPVALLDPASVIAVKPLYFRRSEHGNLADHLLGSTLEIKSPAGLNTQELERLLTCHAARSQLGRPGEPAVANDPYWAPGYAEHLTVEFEEGVTQVHIEGRDFAGAQALWTRAQAFAGK